MEEFEYGESETGPTFDVSNQDETNAIERIIDISAGAKAAVTDSETNVHTEVPHIIEIKSDAIITTDQPTHLETEENGAQRRWSHNANVQFLEGFKMALKMNKDLGSKKAIFIEAVKILRQQGITLTVKELEQKYSNMLITFKRCRQKLVCKKKRPTWPYFKDVKEIEKLMMQTLAPYSSSRRKRMHKRSQIDTNSKRLLDFNYESTDKCVTVSDQASFNNTQADGQKYVKILPKPTVNVALFPNTSFDPAGGGGPSYTTLSAIPIPQASGSLSDSFKEKRQKQEYQKLSFVDQLLQECEGASDVEKKYWTELAAEEAAECQLLSAIKEEVGGFRKDLVEGVAQVQRQLNALAHIMLNRR